jgi:hypothetical protein
MLTAILLRKRRRATYMLQSSASSISEGQPITFTLNTTRVPNGTLVPYTITGVTNNDISGASLTGNFTVGATGTATLPITFSNDLLTEGSETFTLTLNNLGISLSVTINDTSTTPITWYQKGSLLTETSPNVGGYGVSVSADGNVVVSTGRTSTSSFISVNRWINYAWVNTKITIPVHSPGNAELQTSISDDGNVIACVYRNHQFEFPSNTSSNYAAVYAWNGSSWNRRGNSFATTSNQDSAVAISGDGSTVAITDDRQVKIYSWDNNSGWFQAGNTISGPANDSLDNAGWAKHISLSYTGREIAISGIYNNMGVHIFSWATFSSWVNTQYFASEFQVDALSLRSTTDNRYIIAYASFAGFNSPHIVVHKSVLDNTSNWNNRGQTIPITGADSLVYNPNNSMSIDKDGNRIIWSTKQDYNVNGDSTNSTIHIVDWNGTNWQQTGTITPDPSNSNNGYSIALSQDGQTIAFGAPNYNKVTVHTTTTFNIWSQLGLDIDGNPGDYIGRSVSMNADGNRVAIGAPDSYYNPSISASRGHVQIHEYNSSTQTWTQLGQDINGEFDGDQCGWSVSMNAIGDRVAIGAIKNDGNGSNSGHTRIYEYNSSTQTWTQLGQDINGEFDGDQSGFSVSMNATGDMVAIGAPYNNVNGANSIGHVRIYQYNLSTQTWTKLGQDIDGESYGDNSGACVSMNATGDRVAIGAPTNRSTSGNNTGHVRIYQYNSLTQAWTQLGQDVDGAAGANTGFGIRVYMNAAGDRFVVGAPGYGGTVYAGQVRVYSWNSSSSSWAQLGQDINGITQDDYLGHKIGINAAGNRIIIGSSWLNGENGNTRVYEYKESTQLWTQIGQSIDPENPNVYAVGSVSINSIGDKIAIGTPYNDGNGFVSGHVRVYNLT